MPDEQELIEIVEPDPRQQRSSSDAASVCNDETTDHHNEEVDIQLHQQQTVNWWQSGDAPRLLAPCLALYGATCDAKAVVMGRIEVLEAVNVAPSSWKTIVDTRSDSLCFDAIHRQMYSHCGSGVCT